MNDRFMMLITSKNYAMQLFFPPELFVCLDG